MSRIGIFLAMCLSASPAGALFGDYIYDAKTMGMGSAAAAYESVFSFKYNPALAGGVREPSAAVSHAGAHFWPGGEGRYRTVSLDAVFPSRIQIYNVGYSFSYSSVYGSDYDQRAISLGAGSWHLRDFSSGESLDGGINLKSMSVKGPGGISESGIGADLGALLRLRDYQLGFSLLNFKAPSFPRSGARASKSMKIGVARLREDYSLCADLTRRDSPDNNYTISAGAERFFRTYGGAVVSAFAGIGAGDNKSFASFGGGYKKMSYELLYSFALSLNGPLTVANSISFSFRFGSTEEETEYQKLIAMEMKYRRDLMTSLDQSEEARIKLRKELDDMRREIERLYDVIKNEKGKIAELEDAKKRLDEVVRRQNQSREELRLLEEKRRQDRIRQMEENYSLDWKNYLKMKSSGASYAALKGYLQKLINQYQGSGVDISDATMEMRRLSGI